MAKRKSAGAAAISLLACLTLEAAANPAHATGDTEITVATCDLYYTITPGNAVPCGGDVLDALFTGLIEYVPGTSRSRYGVAKSITTKDNRRFRVTLRKGWKFHDGTPVRARNFVEAWNLAANGGKAMNAFLFEEIKGYGKRRMSGLKVTGDHTFTIELTKPFGPFLKKLGHVAFSPLPDSVLKSPASLTRKPIGNGPFRVVKWSPGGEYVVERFDGYAGTAKPYVSKITYRTYRNDEAAYRDLLAGDLDFLGAIPYSKGAGYKKELDGRVIARPATSSPASAFPGRSRRTTTSAGRYRWRSTGRASPSGSGRGCGCPHARGSRRSPKAHAAKAAGWPARTTRPAPAESCRRSRDSSCRRAFRSITTRTAATVPG